MIEYDELLFVRYGIADNPDIISVYEQYGTSAAPWLKQMIQGKQLVVALDQATIKTGMCIMDFDTRHVLAVFDIINRGFPSKQLYFESLYSFVNELIAKQNVRYFIYEIPVEHSKNYNTLALLEAMRLFVKNFKQRIPSLESAEMIEINSNTWKSNFLADPCYQGKRKARKDVKESARIEACKRAPSLTLYFNSFDEPSDSCDAVGIAYGALEEIYSRTNKDIRKPNKTMPRKNIKFAYHIEVLGTEGVLDFVKLEYPIAYQNSGYELLEFNPGLKDVEDNCRRYCGVSNKIGIIPITDRKTMQELKWETGKEAHKGEYYFVFCRRGGLE